MKFLVPLTLLLSLTACGTSAAPEANAAEEPPKPANTQAPATDAAGDAPSDAADLPDGEAEAAPEANQDAQTANDAPEAEGEAGDAIAQAEPEPGEGQGEPPPEGEEDPNAAMPPPPSESTAPTEGLAAPPPREDQAAATGSVVLISNNSHKIEGEYIRPQDDIKAKLEYVTFKGKITCEGCTEPMVLRVVPYADPNQGGDIGDRSPLITFKKIARAGSYEVLIPKEDLPVVLDLLVDKNGDGHTTKGERFAILERAGQLIPNADRTGIDIDVSPSDSATTMDKLKPGQPVDPKDP